MHRFSIDKKNNVSTCRAEAIDRLFIIPLYPLELLKWIFLIKIGLNILHTHVNTSHHFIDSDHLLAVHKCPIKVLVFL